MQDRILGALAIILAGAIGMAPLVVAWLLI